MSSGNETKKFCEALADKFPKFSRVQMCMIRNPEYGIQLAPEAVSVLRDKGVLPKVKVPVQSVKQAYKRKKPNRFTVRLSDSQTVRFLQAKEASGCATVQEYLEKLIMEEASAYSDDSLLEMSGGDQINLWDADLEGSDPGQ